eukprot:1527869-Rhodomonas_salina.4
MQVRAGREVTCLLAAEARRDIVPCDPLALLPSLIAGPQNARSALGIAIYGCIRSREMKCTWHSAARFNSTCHITVTIVRYTMSDWTETQTLQ